ncbi:helix-turn-helix domain-containing protein [Clostridium algidicarnis]|uniref:helix-turn-helix domain-containing protein n=1 Tax=Clostridium algidicarnis TaxID=37659 RepID=UPI003FD7F590
MNNKIKEIRIRNGLGLNETARRVGITGGYLSALEKGVKKNPSLETLNGLSKILNVPINQLFVENSNQDMEKEITVSLTREEFKELTGLILAESSEENNEISIFTHEGSIKFGITRKVTQTEVLAEYFEGDYKNE